MTALGARLAELAEQPAGLGQAMLVVTGLIASVTAPTLGLSDRAWLVLAVVSAAMLGVLVVSTRVTWVDRGNRAMLVFPSAVLTALLALGVTQPTTFAPLTGLMTFVFAFVGLTQPAGTSLRVMPFAAGVYLIVNGQLVAPIVVRLLVATLVWLFLGELLAQMTARRRTLTAALERSAHCDTLTGLDNRRVWDRRLGEARPGTTIVMCDLDHFKTINDTHGHSYGDDVLCTFGAMLLTQLRSVDCAARYGGEEFALLLTDAAIEDATAIVARLHQSWAVLRPDVTFSAGLAVCRRDRSNLDTFRSADAALYEAKAAGRNTDRIDTVT